MNAEDTIRAALIADAGVAALVGTRVFPELADQQVAFPLVVYERSTTEPTTSIHTTAVLASKATITVSSWSRTRAEAKQVGNAVMVALQPTATPTDRFSHLDPETLLYGDVIVLDVWEI